MSQWPAVSKPSNTLRECSVICVEPALENIGWNGGPAIPLNGATLQIHNESLFRLCNSYDLDFAAQIWSLGASNARGPSRATGLETPGFHRQRHDGVG